MANFFEEFLAANPGWEHPDPLTQRSRQRVTISKKFFGNNDLSIEERAKRLGEFRDLSEEHFRLDSPGKTYPRTAAGIFGNVGADNEIAMRYVSKELGRDIGWDEYLGMGVDDVVDIVNKHTTPHTESWRASLPNEGHWIPPEPRPTTEMVEDVPDLDFSVLKRERPAPRKPVPKVATPAPSRVEKEATKTWAQIGEEYRQTGRGVRDLAKKTTKHYTDQLGQLYKRHETKLPPGTGKVIEFVQNHPTKAVAIPTAIAAALVLRHHRKKKNANLGNYSTTIARGNQSRPSGSAAGMNNAPSAWIQMNGAGYGNPSQQGAKYGFTRGYPMASYPTMGAPSGSSAMVSMADRRYGNYDIAQDQQLSSMI